MLDKEYIEELRLLCAEDKKAAKEQLIQFAQDNYGITLKRVKRSFDFLVEELTQSYNKLNDEPLPEQNEGLTVKDIIIADDEVNGDNMSDEKIEPEAVELVKQANEINGVIEKPVVPETDYKIEKFNDKKEDKITITSIEDDTIVEKEIKILDDIEELEEVFKEAIVPKFEFPANYSPTAILIGPAPGYINIPYWIFDFIQKEDWKQTIDQANNQTDQKVLLSLLYYIQKYGCVKIRESRNSGFHIIK